MVTTGTVSTDINTDNYKMLQDFVYKGSGIVLDDGKQYLLEARLTPIARTRGLRSLNDLCALIRATSDISIHRQVIEAMTTNETYFFREPNQYDALKKGLLQELVNQRKSTTRKLSFWSAASSSGQEAYSLSMMLQEMGLGDWNIQILGTDLTTEVLNRARAAKYMQIEVNRGLPTPLLLKNFKRSGSDWILNEDIKKRVRFEQFDLRNSMRAFGPFDAVFIRNVLVYFDVATRTKILKEIHGTLFRGGWLLLGTAEVLPDVESLYERKAIDNAVVYVAR